MRGTTRQTSCMSGTGFDMIRRRIFWSLSLVLVPLVAFGVFILFLHLSGNFHEVVKAELYRSAQPTADQISSYARDYGIRTIVNLRGAAPKRPWYRDEIARAKELGIEHVDFKMSARRELSPTETEHLIAILRDAPKPILIHCQGGADRSGLVSAIYLHAVHGADVETAEKQISIRYGHISIPYLSSAFAMDENWEKLETMFGAKS